MLDRITTGVGIGNSEHIFRRRGRLLALLCSGIAIPSLAVAQQQAPIFTNIDGNGVDLTTAKVPFQPGPALTIGDPSNALTFYTYVEAMQRPEVSPYGGFITGATQLAATGNVTVSIGAKSETFACTTTTCTSLQGVGSKLTFDSSRSTWNYTQKDGTELRYVTYISMYAGAFPTPILAGVKKSNGETIENFIQSIPHIIPGFGAFEYFRYTGTRSSHGYQVEYSHQTDTTPSPTDALAIIQWQTMTGAKAFNLSDAVCTTLSCTGTPVAQLAYSTTTSGGGTTYNVTDPGGGVWKFRFNNGLAGITRPGSASENVTYAYDTNARVTSVTRDGATWNYAYSVSGTTATMTVTDPASKTRVVVSDLALGRPTSDKNELNQTTSYQYDTQGRLTRMTMPEGNYVQNTYDGRGNVTQQTLVAKTAGTPADIVISAGFDATCSNVLTCNKPNWTKDANGNQTDYTYDATTGLPATITLPAPTAGGVRPQTRYGYTPLQAWFKNGSSGPLVSGAPIYKLTTISQCQTTASCAGAADERKMTIGYQSGSASVPSNLLPVSITEAAGDGSAISAVGIGYDAAGNVKTVDGPLSGTSDTTTYRYDSGRRLTGVVGPDPDGGGARKPTAQRMTYNGIGQITLKEAGVVDGSSDTAWAGFSSQEQVAIIYDGNSRPVKSELKSGGTTYAVAQTNYDALGRVDCTVQRMNPAAFGSLPASACAAGTAGSEGPDRIVKNSYDAIGRITKMQTAYGIAGVQADEVTTAYTDNGKTDYVVDAENNRTEYSYDGHDRLMKTEYPSTTKGANVVNPADYEQLTYDANGNVTSRRLRDGTSIGYTYDNLNRMTFMDRSNAGIDEDITYTYDLLGRMRTAQTPWGHLTYLSYDALGRRTGETTTYGPLKTSQYDAAGRRTRLTWHDGFYVDYDYDVTGNVTAIRENGATSGVGVLATYGYDDLGRRTSITRGNGTTTSYGYDAVSRLASLTQDLGGSTHDMTLGFSYNPASQLAGNTRSNDIYAWNEHYNVDRTYTSNGLNQLTTAGSTALGYDARGNLTSSGGSSYTYGQLNQLVNFPGGTLYYDPLMRLDLIYAASAHTALDYDGSNLSTEYNYDTGAMLRRYVHGPGVDEPIVWYEGAGTTDRRWLHADERGSVIAISNSAGTTTNINSYDEYGIPATGNIGRFGYTGQAWIPELGMWYYKARIYSPTLGRFMQTDPIGYGDGMNWYNYVRSDPVNFVDPKGLGISCGTEYYYSSVTMDGYGPAILQRTVCERTFDDYGGGPGSGPVGGGGGGGGSRGNEIMVTAPQPQTQPGPCGSNLQKIAEVGEVAGDVFIVNGLILAGAGLAVGPEGAVPGLVFAEGGGIVGTLGQVAEDVNHGDSLINIGGRAAINLALGRVAVRGLRIFNGGKATPVIDNIFEEAIGKSAQEVIDWLDPERCP